RFPRELLAITQLAGPQYLSSTLDVMPARTARDYQDIVARLDGIPQRLGQVEARLRRGVETGVVSPRVILRDVAAQIDAQTPQDLNQLGVSEVKRIRGEMEKVLARVGFKGTLADFATFLRTDPRFYFTDARELVREYRDIAKRVDPELTRLFGKLPRLPYGVVEIPAFSAPSQTTAYYRQGSPEAHRPGSYFVNTYKLDTRPKREMEALTLHESVPGHHLQ